VQDSQFEVSGFDSKLQRHFPGQHPVLHSRY
jgi:hypothetical protein